jgi:hypothetical protein
VCQILEVDDEWNIVKCTLHWKGVQKTSITLAKLVEFLVISIFHEKKIRTVDMKVQVYPKFREKKFKKKLNLQTLWGMEDLTLPSVEGSLKKCVYCAPILPNILAHSPNFQKNKILNIYSFKKGQADPVQASTRGRRATAGRHASFFLNFFFLLPSTFCASGQLLLVGSSTCLPCPEFT